MSYFKKKADNISKDYKDRFEFILTTKNAKTGESIIICQRYFKIIGFNEKALMSSRIKDSVIRCARMINNDLIDKSNLYTRLVAPMVFSNEREMYKYFENPENRERLSLGEGIVIRNENSPNYVWSKKGPKIAPTNFSKVEFVHQINDEDIVEFTLTFKDHGVRYYKDGEWCMNNFGNVQGREICSYTWTNVLPRPVKMGIDLSNKNSKITKEELKTLSGEAWIIYKLSENRKDLIFPIINDFCTTCCVPDDTYYTEADPWGEEVTIQENIPHNISKALCELVGEEA